MKHLNEQACIYLSERELSMLLEDLSNTHSLRDRLQKAGENIFGW